MQLNGFCSICSHRAGIGVSAVGLAWNIAVHFITNTARVLQDNLESGKQSGVRKAIKYLTVTQKSRFSRCNLVAIYPTPLITKQPPNTHRYEEMAKFSKKHVHELNLIANKLL